MKTMSLKAKIIAILAGIILAVLAYVQAEIWYVSSQAEQADPPQTEETQP